uniref:DM2 domain-containing protein n=1 Tax=Daucus carota subsp. sativus TaxID=79200 RepID=A0A166AZZ5_DAUCS
MVSNSELVKRLHEILSTSDLNTTTTGIVRRKLEEELGVSLPKKQKKKVKRKGGGGGFAKVCSLSPELQNFTGVSKLPRTEVVKQMWNYIREKELQEPSDRRTINCDDALRALFNVDSINMFQMNKALAKHIWPLESNGEEQEEGEAEVADEEGSDDEKATIKSKKQNKNVKGKGSGGSGGGGFKKVCSLSPELQKFTGVPELPRTEVVKQLWSYIKENNLQDPSDRRNIICDDSLRVLFNVDSINMFQMNKALAKHIRPLDSDASVNSTPKEKQLKHEREDSDVPKRKEKVPKRKEKRQKSCDTEEVATIPLSDALDPFDTGRIISDEKLKELFEVDTFNGLAVTKILKSHFVKAEK